MQEHIERIAIGLGHKPDHVNKWRERGKVPYRHRLPIAQQADSLWGIKIEDAHFDNMKLIRSPRSSKKVNGS